MVVGCPTLFRCEATFSTPVIRGRGGWRSAAVSFSDHTARSGITQSRIPERLISMSITVSWAGCEYRFRRALSFVGPVGDLARWEAIQANRVVVQRILPPAARMAPNLQGDSLNSVLDHLEELVELQKDLEAIEALSSKDMAA